MYFYYISHEAKIINFCYLFFYYLEIFIFFIILHKYFKNIYDITRKFNINKMKKKINLKIFLKSIK